MCSRGLFALWLFTVGGLAQARTRDLTQVEARELVYQALDSRERQLPKLDFDFYSDPIARNFYLLAVTWDNPGGSVIVGHFAVNQVTGDVWRLVVCEKLKSPDLKRLQKTMQDRIGVNSEERHEFSSKAPCEH